MRLNRYHLGTDSLPPESYRFPNKRHAPAAARCSRSFIFVALKAPPLAAPDRARNNAEIATFDRRVVVRIAVPPSPAASGSKPQARFVRRNDAPHLARPLRIVAMKPFVTAKMHDGEIHVDKATAGCSFRLGRADIQNCAALYAFRKALAAIRHK